MNDKKIGLMYGSLLHDIGKVLYRCNDGEITSTKHSKMGYEYLKKIEEFNKKDLLDSVKYHHAYEIKSAKISDDSTAYITYIADNIASGIDRRDDIEEGDTQSNERFRFEKYTPLRSVFNVVNNDLNESKGSYSFLINERVCYPNMDELPYSVGQYNKLKSEFLDPFFKEGLKYGEKHFASLLQFMESLFNFIPSSTNTKQLVDISLYDHSKITCAMACNIYDYLQEKNITNYKDTLFKNADDFYKEEAFLLVSLDFSGIQDFIYNISGEKALKSLRARSFYLEFMLESIADDILDKLELSRANLIYTGGGHAYFILANTEKTKKTIDEFEHDLKDWFIKKFKTDLSIVIASQECTSNELMNKNETYKDIWRNVSVKLSKKKLSKYSYDDIVKLNNTISYGERECKECLRSDLDLADGRCPICEGLINISSSLKDKNKKYIILSNTGDLEMPSGLNISVTSSIQDIEKLNENGEIRIYTKNEPNIGENVYKNIWMADYSNEKGAGIADYVKRDIGIKRLGVLRADIDDLGKTFIKGIDNKFNSLSRTATLSRNLAMFFKYEINSLLKENDYDITVIYSGGDDLFLIGAWDDVLDASILIKNKFKEYTQDRLTISAGFNLFHAKYPISKMANEVGELEKKAKLNAEKNSIALFNDRVFKWDVFEKQIKEEMLDVIRRTFNTSEDYGKGLIYKIIELLRVGKNNYYEELDLEPINLARLAYLLTRIKIREDKKDELSKYIDMIYKWAIDERTRNHLIIALELYIYEIREGE